MSPGSVSILQEEKPVKTEFNKFYPGPKKKQKQIKDAVTLGNLSCNLSRNLLRHRLHGSLPGVTSPERNMSRIFFAVAIVARSRSQFYFVQRRLQQKRCEAYSLQGMLH